MFRYRRDAESLYDFDADYEYGSWSSGYRYHSLYDAVFQKGFKRLKQQTQPHLSGGIPV